MNKSIELFILPAAAVIFFVVLKCLLLWPALDELNFRSVLLDMGLITIIFLLYIIFWSAKSSQKTKEMEKLVKDLPVPVMLMDSTGDIIACSASARQFFQCQKGCKRRDCPVQLLQLTIKNETPLENYSYQLELKNSEKKYLIINTQIISLPGEQRFGAVLTAHDATMVSEQFQQAEKMSIISELVDGVAHQIKNPLTTTRGILQLLDENLSADNSVQGHIRMALKETDKINDIIKELMLLSQPAKPNLTFTQIESVLDEVSLLIDSEAVLNNITVKRTYQPNLPLAVMDVNQMKRVFLNLAVNGINAMPNGGVLCITVRYNSRNRNFEIAFQDSGIGIKRDEIKKIFYPFYSCSSGIGLGLTMCQRLVSQHGGYITVQSEENKGSIFTVYLPIVNEVQQGAAVI